MQSPHMWRNRNSVPGWQQLLAQSPGSAGATCPPGSQKSQCHPVPAAEQKNSTHLCIKMCQDVSSRYWQYWASDQEFHNPAMSACLSLTSRWSVVQRLGIQKLAAAMAEGVASTFRISEQWISKSPTTWRIKIDGIQIKHEQQQDTLKIPEILGVTTAS